MAKYILDEKRYIPVNGSEQHIHIRSNIPEGPVLLFVHGGPGVCDRSWVMPVQSQYLADSCVMVCWDQRMAGKNYRSELSGETMTLEQQVEDMHAVILYLLERFHKEKLTIVGHSWGSILSCLYLPRYPETIAAYVGMGQFVDGPKNELMSYEFVVNYAKEHKSEKALRDLAAIGAPVDGMYAGGLDALMIQRDYMTKFGGGCYRHKEGIIKSVVVPFLTSGEYHLIPDLYRYAKGSYYCLRQLWPQVVQLHFGETLKKVEVPVYIFQGEHDQNTPTVLAREWFDALEAPYKEWVPFSLSAHSPIKEEPELWGNTLRQKLFSE